MALAIPLITFTDGTGNASQSPANNSTNFVTPGNILTVTLASSTGVLWADFVIIAPGTPLDGYRPSRAYSTPFAFSIQLPLSPLSFQLYISVFDGNNPSVGTVTFVNGLKTAGQIHRARGVVTVNESLTAFDSVTGGTIRDGVTYVQGDVVLLVSQTSASQNGPYYVGAVAAGAAPLSRVPDWTTGTVFSAGQAQVFEVSGDGTAWGNSTWKVTTTGAITVDTTNIALFPRFQRGRSTLAGGTFAVNTGWILAAGGANGSKVFAVDTTATAAVGIVSIVAGAGNGTFTINGTTTDVIDWGVFNW